MHRDGFVAPRAFQMMSVAALTDFDMANLLLEPVCDVHLLSEAGGSSRHPSEHVCKPAAQRAGI
jgi:hypothetical protein